MEVDEEKLKIVRKWALKNAKDYGKAAAGKVVGKVLVECPECKDDVKSLMGVIVKECQRVNELSVDELEQGLSEFSFEQKKKDEEKKIELADAVQGGVVTRFPPEPGGYLHSGHAKAAFLNYEGACNYSGKMRLRMDDTNPAKAKQEFEDAIVEDLKWLGVKWSGEITHTSDYIERLYKHADEMIIKHKAYVCTCKPEVVKKKREVGEQCVCRAKMAEENLADFRKMKEGDFEEGKAVLRFAGDMKAQNTAMRDPTLFRIVKKEHFRCGEKYSCWPAYDFAAPILDSVEGVTHAMRSKEYELRDELYYAILDELEMKKPKLISFSRLAIKNAPVSKRLITPLIEEGKVSGYDDIRLPTLRALRKRGIKQEAIKKFVLSFGLSKVESEPGWDKLLSENRKIVDGEAVRRFFVAKPAKVKLSGVVAKKLELKNHPQNESLGKREVETSSVCYIASKDAQGINEGEVFRLKDWCNVKCVAKSEESGVMPNGEQGTMNVIEAEFVSEQGNVEKKMQWVSDTSKVHAKVNIAHDLLVDGKFNENSLEVVDGWAEKSCLDMQEGQVAQFERFGFVVLADKGDLLEFNFVSQ